MTGAEVMLISIRYDSRAIGRSGARGSEPGLKVQGYFNCEKFDVLSPWLSITMKSLSLDGECSMGPGSVLIGGLLFISDLERKSDREQTHDV